MTVNSPQNLLSGTILIGFASLLTGVIVGFIVYLLGWPTGLYTLAFGLVAFGLLFLVTAWRIRQGLVHGRLVRYVTRLMNRPRKLKQKLKK